MSELEVKGVHPYADTLEMLPEDELQALANSIRTSGLRQPIVLTPDGLILDGRNRYKACQMAGIEPEFVEYDGNDLDQYVIDVNLSRRNLPTGVRAMCAALIMQKAGRRENGHWKRGTVVNPASGINEDKTWQNNLNMAGTVLDYLPQLAEAIANGRMALDAAYKDAKRLKDSAEADKVREREQRRLAKQEAEEAAKRDADIIAKLTQAGSKYVQLIDQGVMKPPAAYAAYLEDTRKQRERRQMLERGWRDSLRFIQESVNYLAGGEQEARIFLDNAYPHERQLSPEGMWLTYQRVDQAINYLQTIKEGIRS